jgi:D-3-phosphoglycerate dehydrogenase
MKIGILEHRDFSEIALEKLGGIGTIKFYDDNLNFQNFIYDLNVLFVRLGYKIDKKFLSHANSLEFICSPTTGVNHIDLNYLKESNIELINLRGEYEFLDKINATSEHTIGLIISLLRNYGKVFRSNAESDWVRDLYKGRELSRLKVGIIGLGRIGLKVAKICNSFSSKVGWFDLKEISTNDEYIKFSSIDDLISESNIIVLSADHSSEQKPILQYEQLAKMGGKYFINTARAELVDDDVLYNLASCGFFAGLAIDVIKDEQKSISRWRRWKALRDSYNVIVTPHIGGCTFESMCETEIFIADKLIKCLYEAKRI